MNPSEDWSNHKDSERKVIFVQRIGIVCLLLIFFAGSLCEGRLWHIGIDNVEADAVSQYTEFGYLMINFRKPDGTTIGRPYDILSANDKVYLDSLNLDPLQPFCPNNAIPSSLRSWATSNGRDYEAQLLQDGGFWIVLLERDGNRVTIKRQDLSPADKSYLKDRFRIWTLSNGKAVYACLMQEEPMTIKLRTIKDEIRSFQFDEISTGDHEFLNSVIGQRSTKAVGGNQMTSLSPSNQTLSSSSEYNLASNIKRNEEEYLRQKSLNEVDRVERHIAEKRAQLGLDEKPSLETDQHLIKDVNTIKEMMRKDAEKQADAQQKKKESAESATIWVPLFILGVILFYVFCLVVNSMVDDRENSRIRAAENARIIEETRLAQEQERLRAQKTKQEASNAQERFRAQERERVRAENQRSKHQEESRKRTTDAGANVVKDERYYGRILGLSGPMTFSEVKSCYRSKVSQYHPDKVNHLGPKIKEIAEKEMKDINEAMSFFERKYNKPNT